MDIQRILLVLALCLILGLMLGVIAEPAEAQTRIEEREGLATKEFDSDRLPGKLEIGLAVGSIFALIAVFKWL